MLRSLMRCRALGNSHPRLEIRWAWFGLLVLATTPLHAQLRTGRGYRDFYDQNRSEQIHVKPASVQLMPDGVDEAELIQNTTPLNSQNTAEIHAMGARSASHAKAPRLVHTKTPHRVSASSAVNASKSTQLVRPRRTQAVRTASATATAFQAGDQPMPTPIPEPIPEPIAEPLAESAPPRMSESVHASGECVNCQSSNGIYHDSHHSSCDGMSCDSDCQTNSMAFQIDFGCSPLARIAQTMTNRLYFRADLASFWQNNPILPALVTTGPEAVGQDNVGRADRADTVFLFGGRTSDTSKVNTDSRTGYRLTIGTWFDRCQDRGVMVRLYDAGTWSTDFNANQDTQSIIARPFFNVGVNPNVESTNLVAFPNLASGNINVRATSEAYGGDLLLRKRLFEDCFGRYDILAGYQQGRVDELLQVSTSSTQLVNGQATGTRIDVRDQFETTNRFHGATLGLKHVGRLDCWSLESMFKLGFGNMQRIVDIEGFRRTTVSPTNQFEEAQGLLARNSNSGRFIDETFVVSPEFNLTLGYQISPDLDFTIGYSFLSLPKVARVSDQVDAARRSNLTNPLTGTIAPLFSLVDDHYELSSLNLGLQWRY